MEHTARVEGLVEARTIGALDRAVVQHWDAAPATIVQGAHTGRAIAVLRTWVISM